MMDDGCKYCGSGKGEMFLTSPPFHRNKDQCIRNLQVKLADVEKRAQAAQDEIAKLLELCSYREGSDGCKSFCDSFGCETLRKIRAALKECAMGDTCKNCGSGKGEMFMASPPFHTDKEQCIKSLRAELVDAEKQAARMKAVVDAAIKWREARRAIPDAQLLDDPMEENAAHAAYDNAIRILQSAVSELE